MTTQPPEKKSYKQTLNLPSTSFAMEAKLVQNEPARLAKWQAMDLYGQIMQARAAGAKWVLHDGPPFANGDIHIGHLINKTLKDVVIRFRTMEGYQTPYVPGWDCHGLPIEHKIQQELGPKLREMAVADVRQKCFDYAAKYAKVQSEQFQRLGILGDWAHPYLTMAPEYEASTLEVFARFVEAGLVYKRLKPVPWSITNQTALADAELEYQDVQDPSVYVEFPAVDSAAVRALFEGNAEKSVALTGDLVPSGPFDGNPDVFFLVWTTTPWTLPANLAIAVHPAVNYAAVQYTRDGRTRVGIVAYDLIGAVFNRPDVQTGYRYVASLPGSALVDAKVEYKHAFIDRTGPILPALYVTTTDGTGLVHTAPGHGDDDYNTGMAHGLPVYCPVLANGRFDDTVPAWIRGLSVWEANPIITKHLADAGLLLDEVKITHSYPHDWRSKTKVISRATEQWFVDIDKPFAMPSDYQGMKPKGLRDREIQAIGFDLQSPTTSRQQAELDAFEKEEHERWVEQMQEEELHGPPTLTKDPTAVEELDRKYGPQLRWLAERSIELIPRWGRNRLRGMLESRPDWCISRQRAWGLPIPVFYNEKGDALLTPHSVRAVARTFAKHGSNVWFTLSPAELLGGDFHYPPGFAPDKLRKEKDIFDVWFESGSSWNAVLRARPELDFPCELYLEGSDQHRGWFQLSLLCSLGATGVPPFKQVLTHGWVMKPDGTKVSKSDKEYVTATQEINHHGADLLRLWCCSVDYQGDIAASPAVIKEFGDKYRKIRNTLRYLLSNLYDFDAAAVAPVPPNSLDAWALAELDQLIKDVREAYNEYQLHRVFRLLHEFCAVQISAIYGNAMKDRLYCEAPNAPLRRRCQSVMHRMALALTKLLAPMAVFTADEAWEHIPAKPAGEANLASVHLALLPEPSGQQVPDAVREEWKLLIDLRNSALGQLDDLKKQAGLNKALDADVVFTIPDPDMRRRLEAYSADLEDMVGAGYHSFADAAGAAASSVKVIDRRNDWAACARSWKRRPDVGQDREYPDLSARDAAAVRGRVASC